MGNKYASMDQRVKAADKLHAAGYNCAQSVLCIYEDMLEVDEDILFKVSEGFGAGMADMQDVCGAVTGMLMIAGLVNSCGVDCGAVSKPQTMQMVRRLKNTFAEMNQSVICKDLKGVDTGKMLRSCPGCIEDAIRIAGKMIFGLED